MKKNVIITAVTAAVMMLLAGVLRYTVINMEQNEKVVSIGFIYDGDESTPYTANFMRAQYEILEKYQDKVNIIPKSNIAEGDELDALNELVNEGCSLIFTTSYGYSKEAKKLALQHPEIQFCQATGDNANVDPICSNYHTFMGRIYEGRYTCGKIAGLKLKELIDEGRIKPQEAVIGYVAAFPYAEVISGYTAFFLGIRSVVPEATMRVRYTNTWSNYTLEYETAKKLIEEGCIIISQHSDTIGPAVACEEEAADHTVYHVGYNQSMIDVAPTTSLVSSRINWNPYMLSAVDAVMSEKDIEDVVRGVINGNDVCGGFDKEWVEMMEVNEQIAPDDYQKVMEDTIKDFRGNGSEIFRGDYTGTDPFDATDTISLKTGYKENEEASAPSFHYVLDDVITVEE